MPSKEAGSTGWCKNLFQYCKNMVCVYFGNRIDFVTGSLCCANANHDIGAFANFLQWKQNVSMATCAWNICATSISYMADCTWLKKRGPESNSHVNGLFYKSSDAILMRLIEIKLWKALKGNITGNQEMYQISFCKKNRRLEWTAPTSCMPQDTDGCPGVKCCDHGCCDHGCRGPELCQHLRYQHGHLTGFCKVCRWAAYTGINWCLEWTTPLTWVRWCLSQSHLSIDLRLCMGMVWIGSSTWWVCLSSLHPCQIQWIQWFQLLCLFGWGDHSSLHRLDLDKPLHKTHHLVFQVQIQDQHGLQLPKWRLRLGHVDGLPCRDGTRSLQIWRQLQPVRATGLRRGLQHLVLLLRLANLQI